MIMILILISLYFINILCEPIIDNVNELDHLNVHHHHQQPLWEVNNPIFFRINNSINHNGQLLDVRNDVSNMTFFETISQWHLDRTDVYTDGEVVDAMEHFFWGKRNGIAMELGALDGSPGTRSMTYEYEKSLGWKRILIEGDPQYRVNLLAKSPEAYSVNAAICERHSIVHYANAEYIGGILEFMAYDFLKEYHNNIFNSGIPPGNLSSINWDDFPTVATVDCIPLGIIFHRTHIRHVNFFILDVEGGELEVLRSINFDVIRFDVMCIETEANNRPPGFEEKITSFLRSKGYNNVTSQIGRNTWFMHPDFIPSLKPGLDPNCFLGAMKSMIHRFGEPIDPKCICYEYNNKIIKQPGAREIFLVINGTRHGFPDITTFMAMGYDLENVVSIPPKVMDQIGLGPPLPHMEI